MVCVGTLSGCSYLKLLTNTSIFNVLMVLNDTDSTPKWLLKPIFTEKDKPFQKTYCTEFEKQFYLIFSYQDMFFF